MVFGYAAAAVAGFLLTAIPNWTGRMPLQGGPLPILGALSLLLLGNLLVHVGALELADTGELGNRIGLVTLLMLISLVGGRIIPSFTRNWLTKARPEVAPPEAAGRFDLAALVVTGLALLIWTIAPDGAMTPWDVLAAGMDLALRL